MTIKSSDDLSDDEAAAVVEVSQTRTAEGGTIRVKLADKRQALADLTRLHGYVPERSAVAVFDSDPEREERARLVRAELHRMLDAMAKPQPLMIDVDVQPVASEPARRAESPSAVPPPPPFPSGVPPARDAWPD